MSTPGRKAVTLSVLLLLLAGCGGGGESAQSERSDDAAAAPSEDASQAPAVGETAAPSDEAPTETVTATGMRVGPLCEHVDAALLEEVFGAPPKVHHQAEPGDVLPKVLAPPDAKDFKTSAHLCYYSSDKQSQDTVYLAVREADGESYEAGLKNAKQNTEFTKCKVEEDVLFGPQSYIERCSDDGNKYVRHTAVIGTTFFACTVVPPDTKDAEAVEALAAGLCGGVVEAMST